MWKSLKQSMTHQFFSTNCAKLIGRKISTQQLIGKNGADFNTTAARASRIFNFPFKRSISGILEGKRFLLRRHHGPRQRQNESKKEPIPRNDQFSFQNAERSGRNIRNSRVCVAFLVPLCLLSSFNFSSYFFVSSLINVSKKALPLWGGGRQF